MTDNDATRSGTTPRQSATGTYVLHRSASETPATSVIEAVATVTGTTPTNLGPLYEVVDPDALNQLCDPQAGTASESVNRCISFRFETCDVTVHADGRTVVSQQTADGS